MVCLSALSAACAALLSPAPVLPAPQDDYLSPERFRWSSSAAIDARPQPRGVFATAGYYYGEYRGRKLETKELTVGGAVTPNVSLWYGRQSVLLKGRARTSRFDFDSDFYGVRWVFRPPVEEGGPSFAFEFEATRPEEATARTATSLATFIGPKVNSFAFTGSLRNQVQAQLGYTRVEGVNGERGHVFSLTGAKDFDLSDRFIARLQGHLIGQRISGSVDDVEFEIKPAAFVALGYRLASGVRLESDITFMPSGTPIALGRQTGLNSFQIYRPSGPAAGLRSDAFGVGSLRLVIHKSF